MNGGYKDYDIVLRDPEGLLRRHFKNENLKVLKYESEPLTKIGDNYGSTMLKVHFVIKKDDTSEEEELNLVAKMFPPTNLQREIFNSTFTFKKEIFLYKDLIPTYSKIYKSVFNDELDITPAYYGSRLSLNDESCNADDDAVILLENLKLNGYYSGDRLEGLDLDHMKALVTTLVKFHSIGYVVKKNNPSFMEKLKLYAKPMSEKEDSHDDFLKTTSAAIRADPQMSRYAERIFSTKNESAVMGEHLDPRARWAVPTHHDAWMNNQMGLKKSGKIENVKLVDFQTYHFSSPLTDILFLLCTSMPMPFAHFDEVIEFYRQSMISTLEKFGHDSSLFEKDEFQERIKVDARNEMYHILLISRAVHLRKDEDVMKDPPNEYFMARTRKMIEIFAEKNWI